MAYDSEKKAPLGTYKARGIYDAGYALRACTLRYDEARLREAFAQLKEKIGDLVPNDYVFELHAGQETQGRSVVVFGTLVAESIDSHAYGDRAKFKLMAGEKEFLAAVNQRLGGKSYRKFEDLITREIAGLLGTEKIIVTQSAGLPGRASNWVAASVRNAHGLENGR